MERRVWQIKRLDPETNFEVCGKEYAAKDLIIFYEKLKNDDLHLSLLNVLRLMEGKLHTLTVSGSKEQFAIKDVTDIFDWLDEIVEEEEPNA